MSNTSLTDKVLTEIMRGCKRQASKEAREELAASRGTIKRLLVQKNKMEKRLKELEEGERSIKYRENCIKITARKLLRSVNSVKALKARKVGNIVGATTFWRDVNKEAAALRAVMKMVK